VFGMPRRGGGKEKSVSVEAVVKLKIGNKEYVIRDDPPLPAFYEDIAAEMFAPQNAAVLKPIGDIEVVDAVGAEVCSISGSALSLSVMEAEVTASGSCTYNSDQPPSKIRVYGGAKERLYFETPVPAGVAAQKGLPVSVTWTATVYVSQGSASGYLAGAVFDGTYLAKQIAAILGNQRGGAYITLDSVGMLGRYGAQTGVEILPKTKLQKDLSTRRAFLPPTRVASAGEVMRVTVYAYYGGSYYRLLEWALSPYLSVTANDYVSFDLVLQV
jgi:hypothetical protein